LLSCTPKISICSVLPLGCPTLPTFTILSSFPSVLGITDIWDPWVRVEPTVHNDLITSNREACSPKSNRNRTPRPTLTNRRRLPNHRRCYPPCWPVPATSLPSRPNAPLRPLPTLDPASQIVAAVVPVGRCQHAPCSGRTGSRPDAPPPPELRPIEVPTRVPVARAPGPCSHCLLGPRLSSWLVFPSLELPT
jgi:hypothetical protein